MNCHEWISISHWGMFKVAKEKIEPNLKTQFIKYDKVLDLSMEPMFSWRKHEA